MEQISEELQEPRGESLEQLSSSKERRLELIRSGDEGEARDAAAAIEIQRAGRSYITRKRLQRLQGSTASETMRGMDRLSQEYQVYVNDMLASGLSSNSPQIMSFDDFCSNQTQSEQRTVVTNDKPKKAEKPRTTKEKRNEAVCVIQRAWRRHIDVQVFKYYRNLINFRQKGDPAAMLRCINPKEARLIDAASGIHVKFRLAGGGFPPNIYYKIFTHRPIQDMCANSPKDYTRAEAKGLISCQLNNRGMPTANSNVNKEGWYNRWENNGWRMVSDRLIQHAMSDPVTYDTTHKKVNFPHMRLQRREDVERNRRHKKIQWLQKMYKQGMVQAKAEDPETVALVEGAAQGLVDMVGLRGADAVDEWEVDELLNWTTALNFDQYWGDWKEMATSAPSHKSTDERQGLVAESGPPFELTFDEPTPAVRSIPASTRQSHNTPVSVRSAGSYDYYADH